MQPLHSSTEIIHFSCLNNYIIVLFVCFCAVMVTDSLFQPQEVTLFFQLLQSLAVELKSLNVSVKIGCHV